MEVNLGSTSNDEWLLAISTTFLLRLQTKTIRREISHRNSECESLRQWWRTAGVDSVGATGIILRNVEMQQ
jgi:hypothetical protein